MQKIKYASSNQFHERNLSQLVNEHFKRTYASKYANSAWWIKNSFFITAYFSAFFLFFVLENQWFLMLDALVIGVLTVVIGISIGHDAAHGAISEKKWINRFGLLAFHLVGANSTIWCDRHNNGHHPYVNIPGHDTDIEQTQLVRFSSATNHQWFHKFQVFYLPFLLCFYTLNWFFHRDVKDVISLLKQNQSFKGSLIVLIGFLLTKGWHIGLLLLLPSYLHQVSWKEWLPYFLFIHLSASLFVSVVLLAAHIGDEQEFPIPDENGYINTSFLEHQLKTTADFGTSNPIFNLLFGGFNHHVAHHLFPNINHVHYPKLTPIIKQYLLENGLPYMEHRTWSLSMKSHYLLLLREGDL